MCLGTADNTLVMWTGCAGGSPLAISDDDLLQSAIAGDADAMSALLLRHTPHLRATISGKVPARWRAILDDEDILQETLLQAFLDIRTFRSARDGAFVAWLIRIGQRNLQDGIKWLNAQKREGKHGRAPIADDSAQSLLELVAAEGTTPSSHVARDDAREKLLAAARNLPAAYRAVVEGVLGGESIRKVAQHLGCTEGAAHMRLARAAALLAEALGRASDFL